MRGFQLSILIVCCLVFEVACAVFDPDPPSNMVKAEDGWKRMTTTPGDSADMFRDISEEHDVRISQAMSDKRLKFSWYVRSPENYLIDFLPHAYVNADSCPQEETIELIKVEGHWQVKDDKILCVAT